MTVLASLFDGIPLADVEFWLEHGGAVQESPLTGGRRVLERPSWRWRCVMVFEDLRGLNLRKVEAGLNRLRGPVNHAELYDPRRQTPLGDARSLDDYGADLGTTYFSDATTFDDGTGFDEGLAGTPSVAGADQTGETLLTDGWAPGVTGILRQGDRISLGDNRLHEVSVDADSDAMGRATLTIAPPLVLAPEDNQAISTLRPTAYFTLTDNQQGRNQSKPGLLGGRANMTINFVQDIQA